MDTRHAEVATAAVELGASIINDVSGSLHAVAATLGVGYVGMHSTTVPVQVHGEPVYDDGYTEVAAYLQDLAAAARAGGTDELWIDQGIGFGKTVEDNVRLLRRLPELCAVGVPVLLGVSRKSFIGKVTGRVVEDRLAGSLALIAPVWSAGVDIIRVHDVAETCDTLAVLEAVCRASARPPACSCRPA